MLLAACGGGDDKRRRRRQRGQLRRRAGRGDGGDVIVNILPPQLGYVAEFIADIDGFFKKEG